jgi:two-component system, sporulation sensor kinase E
LALARRIIENYHQGRLFIKRSEVGKGTTFRLILNQ